MRAHIAIGERYERLVILMEVESHRQPNGVLRRRVLCRCDCGAEKVVHLANIRSGHTNSCGCYGKSRGKTNATHNKTGTKSYRAWQDMIQRCYNPQRKRYPEYGGRGIDVCVRWRESFESFYEDMGEPPTKRHSIDRIDNDKGYCRSNCRWAVAKQQSRNTRRNRLLTYGGKTQCLAAWAEEIGIAFSALYYRIQAGWSVEKALTTPSRAKP